MNEAKRRRIEELIETGYEFSASRYLEEGWKLFRQHAGSFIGFMLLYFVISFCANLIPVIGIMISMLIIGPALVVGYYIVAHQLQQQKNPPFEDFFKGFNFVTPLAFQTIIVYVILLMAYSPSIISLNQAGVIDWYMEVLKNPTNPPDSLPHIPSSTTGIFFLNMIPVMYLVVSYLWSHHFIVFYGAGFWEALELSRRLITRRWFTVFSLPLTLVCIWLAAYIPAVVVLAISPLIGGLFAFVVILAFFCLIPVFYCALYAAFADVTELHKEEQADVLNHLVD